MSLLRVADRLVRELAGLEFGPPVTHVYNPLKYAQPAFRAYVERFGQAPREIVLLGMNPGPWGMAQTGVPFGEVGMVRGWLGIDAEIGKPRDEHPKRPVTGLSCGRSEVSGARLWGWARDRFGAPERFFKRFIILNYCPLCFMEESGRNRTPDKLPAREREPLFEACDAALRASVEHIEPTWVIGIGRFAEQRARVALDGEDVRIGTILHPSPASPAANRNWAKQAEAQLWEMGIRLPELETAGGRGARTR